MPMYDYCCKTCAHKSEHLVAKSVAKLDCPKCGSKDYERLLSAPNVRGQTAGQNLTGASAGTATSSMGCGTKCGCHPH